MPTALRFKLFVGSGDRTAASVAEQLGCTRSYIYLLSAGHKTPSLGTAVAIERLTLGAIRCVDWIPVEETAAA